MIRDPKDRVSPTEHVPELTEEQRARAAEARELFRKLLERSADDDVPTPPTIEEERGCPKPGCPYFMDHGECNGECRDG